MDSESNVEIEPWNDSEEEIFFGPVTDCELKYQRQTNDCASNSDMSFETQLQDTLDGLTINETGSSSFSHYIPKDTQKENTGKKEETSEIHCILTDSSVSMEQDGCSIVLPQKLNEPSSLCGRASSENLQPESEMVKHEEASLTTFGTKTRETNDGLDFYELSENELYSPIETALKVSDEDKTSDISSTMATRETTIESEAIPDVYAWVDEFAPDSVEKIKRKYDESYCDAELSMEESGYAAKLHKTDDTFQSCLTSAPSPSVSPNSSENQSTSKLSRSSTFIVKKSPEPVKAVHNNCSPTLNTISNTLQTPCDSFSTIQKVSDDENFEKNLIEEPKVPFNTPNLKKIHMKYGILTAPSETKEDKRTVTPKSVKSLFPPKSFLTPQMPSRSKQTFGSCKTVLPKSKLPVSSPVAKYLKDNPPPPLITITTPKFKISPKRIELENKILKENLPRSKGSLVKKTLIDVTPKSHKYVSGRLPLRTYTPGSTRILNKENVPQSTRRHIPTSTPQPSVIKHKGHVKVPKILVGEPKKQTYPKCEMDASLMEVSVLEVHPTSHSNTLNKK